MRGRHGIGLEWFDGSINDFRNYRFRNYPASMEIAEDVDAQASDLILRHALEVFRFRYSEAESVTGIEAETEVGEDGETLEQWMLDIIRIASAPEVGGRTRLVLHQASFVLPPVELPDDVSKAKARVVAIPVTDLYPDGNYSVCSSPTEIGVNIGNRTPLLMHGLGGITYPENLTDVPLRVGLSQLGRGENSAIPVGNLMIDMHVRKASLSDGRSGSFERVEEKKSVGDTEERRTGCLLLARTNDPAYRHLGTLDESGEETGYLMWVGEIEELNATVNGATSGPRNNFLVKFDDDFEMREGYFYRLRFSFREKPDEEAETEGVKVCDGQDTFTLKIVPEYALWTADENPPSSPIAAARRLPSTAIVWNPARVVRSGLPSIPGVVGPVLSARLSASAATPTTPGSRSSSRGASG